MLKNWILRITHRLWNREISRILGRAYSDRVINSQQLHELTAAFDPTQRHRVHGEHRDTWFSREDSIAASELLNELRERGRINWTDRKDELKSAHQSVPTFTADEVEEIKERVHRNALQSFITPEQKPGEDTK